MHSKQVKRVMQDAHATKDPRYESMRVAVVDDSQHMRTLISSLLYEMGFKQVLMCDDAKEALQTFVLKPVDLIICDWDKHHKDSMKFVRILRTSPNSPCPDTPVLVMSGHTEYEIVMKARNAGVSGFLTKPISTEKFHASVTKVLEQIAAA